MASGKRTAVLAAAVVVLVVLAAVGYAVFFSAGEAKTIPMAEALRRMDGGERVVLLDVRTPEEHAAGFLPGSMLLTLDVAGGFAGRVEELIPDKRATVFVYCRSGNRSGSAAAIMAGLGYRDVYNIGGMNDVPAGIAVTE